MSDPALPTTSAYRSGEWFGVFGERATVLLPPDAKSRVAGLWELADGGADFDELLDGLIAGGLRELAAFALVSSGEEPTRVLVRGELTVQLRTAAGKTVAVDGRAAATWVERTVSGVKAVQVDVGEADGEADSDDLPIRTGLVPVARVRLQTGATPSPAQPAPPPVPEHTTEVLPSSGAPVVPPPPPPSGPPPPAAPPPPPTSAAVVGRLLFSHGQAVEVDRPLLVGRAPDPGRLDPAEQPLLIPVPSPHQEISSTHLLVAPGSGEDEGAPVVTDMDSTNGTVVVLPGQPPEELRPGVPVRLLPGTVIDLGDGLTIQVTGL